MESEAHSDAPALAAEPPAQGEPAPAADVVKHDESGPERPSAPAQRAQRLLSLDAFRGVAILGMLLANNAALGVATPRQLTHAAWNRGVHFADLVFPWFLLIVGIAIPFSVASHRAKGLPAWRYDLRIVSRTVGLILLGCLIDSSLARRPVLGMGVLQLIGLAYCLGAFLYGLPLRHRLIAAAALLVGYWAAIRFVPIPGVGAGAFTESSNLINHLNQVCLQPLGLRGVLSVVPTSALVLIGTAIGDLLRSEAQPVMRKVGYLVTAGAGLAVGGWMWNLDLPFNKPTWTPPYILYTAGLGVGVLACMYLLIDVIRWRWWSFPLVVAGSNAIFAYVVPILVKAHILREWTVTTADGSSASVERALVGLCFHHAGRVGGGWLYTAGYILWWWLVLLWLHRKRLFLRL